jgi:hypothetical protein
MDKELASAAFSNLSINKTAGDPVLKKQSAHNLCGSEVMDIAEQ